MATKIIKTISIILLSMLSYSCNFGGVKYATDDGVYCNMVNPLRGSLYKILTGVLFMTAMPCNAPNVSNSTYPNLGSPMDIVAKSPTHKSENQELEILLKNSTIKNITPVFIYDDKEKIDTLFPDFTLEKSYGTGKRRVLLTTNPTSQPTVEPTFAPTANKSVIIPTLPIPMIPEAVKRGYYLLFSTIGVVACCCGCCCLICYYCNRKYAAGRAYDLSSDSGDTIIEMHEEEENTIQAHQKI